MGIRITITPASGGPAFVLADSELGRGPGARIPMNGMPSFDAAVQVNRYTEGDQPENIDRFNESTTWPVEVSYVFSTIADAMRFAGELQKKVPRTGTVRFEIEGTVFTMKNAQLRPITNTLDLGLTINYRFNISGGLLT